MAASTRAPSQLASVSTLDNRRSIELGATTKLRIDSDKCKIWYFRKKAKALQEIQLKFIKDEAVSEFSKVLDSRKSDIVDILEIKTIENIPSNVAQSTCREFMGQRKNLAIRMQNIQTVCAKARDLNITKVIWQDNCLDHKNAEKT
jgi:hypothetical protein